MEAGEQRDGRVDLSPDIHVLSGYSERYTEIDIYKIDSAPSFYAPVASARPRALPIFRMAGGSTARKH